MNRFFRQILMAFALSHFAIDSAFAHFEALTPEQADRLILDRFKQKHQRGALESLESVPVNPPGSKAIREHLVFETKKDAFDWMRSQEANYRASFGAQTFKMVESHPDEVVLQRYMDETWQAFQELFPEKTNGLPKPHVLVVDTEQTTQFVPGFNDMSVHIVVVMTGMLKKAGGVQNVNKVTGNLAHEFAHSVFLHANRSNESRIRRFYLFEPARQGFESGLPTHPNQAKEMKRLNQVMDRYLELMTMSGEITDAALLNLPSGVYGRSLLQRIWAEIRRLTPKEAACVGEEAAFQGWSQLMSFMGLDFRYVINVGTSAQDLQSRGLENIALGEVCHKGRQAEFRQVYARLAGVSEAQLAQDSGFLALENEVMSAPDTLTGIRKIVAQQRAEMRSIETAPFFKSIGFYTTEQHADDASAIVHAYLERNPGAFGELLRVSMSLANPDYPSMCDETLARGEIPYIGSFVIDHHSNCYRTWNFNRMAERMKEMSKAQIRTFAQSFIDKSIR